MTQNNETDFVNFFWEKHFLKYCEIYFPRKVDFFLRNVQVGIL